MDEWGVDKDRFQLCGWRSEVGVSQEATFPGGNGQETSRIRRVSYALIDSS